MADPRAPDRWAPIATAPTDGRDILVTAGRRQLVAHWSDAPYEGWIVLGREPVQPTHWQALPDPPLDKPGQGPKPFLP